MGEGGTEGMLFSPAVIKAESVELQNASPVTGMVTERWKRRSPISDSMLLSVIESNVREAEGRDRYKYQKAAEEVGRSVDEIKAGLQKKVEKLVSRSDVFRMTSLNLLNYLLNHTGRYLTQFESGRSKGTLDTELRAAAEEKFFGFNKGIPTSESLSLNADKRPVYGYLSDDPNGIVVQKETDLVGNLDFYGDVTVKLKMPMIKERTTVTFADSLDKNMSLVPSPISLPHFSSMGIPDGIMDNRSTAEKLTDFGTTSMPKWGELYAEAQIHGGVTLDDIESIHVDGKDPGKVYVVREVYERFKRSHPDSKIKLVIY